MTTDLRKLYKSALKLQAEQKKRAKKSKRVEQGIYTISVPSMAVPTIPAASINIKAFHKVKIL